MTDNYEVRYLPLFFDDFSKIVDYISINLKNPDAAKIFIDHVEHAILDRQKFPEAFEPYKSDRKRQYPYYRIYVGNYVIYYVVIGRVMEVRRLLSNRQNIESYLI